WPSSEKCATRVPCETTMSTGSASCTASAKLKLASIVTVMRPLAARTAVARISASVGSVLAANAGVASSATSVRTTACLDGLIIDSLASQYRAFGARRPLQNHTVEGAASSAPACDNRNVAFLANRRRQSGAIPILSCGELDRRTHRSPQSTNQQLNKSTISSQSS